MVQGQRVKGQGYSVCKTQCRLTAKSVRICCLLLTRGVAPRALHLWLPDGTSQNAIFSNQKNPENADNMPDRLVRSRGGFRDAMLSQLHAF